MVTPEQVMRALEHVIDPELGVDIVNLGLIYRVEILADDESVLVDMTLTTAGCPLSEAMRAAARQMLLSLEGVQTAQVNLVWNPPWDPSMLTPVGRLKLGYR